MHIPSTPSSAGVLRLHLNQVDPDPFTRAGGLGDLAYPLVSDLKKEISEAYGVLTDEGVALRGLFIIDPEGIVQHATINNLAFGRNVEETLRILQVLLSLVVGDV